MGRLDPRIASSGKEMAARPHPVLEVDKTTYNDKYVVLYDFSQAAQDVAVYEFKTLLEDLESAGFDTEVRAGYEQSLMVFVKAPRDLLGRAVHKSRCPLPSPIFSIVHVAYHFQSKRLVVRHHTKPPRRRQKHRLQGRL